MDYEINNNTLAILSIENKKSKIIEIANEYVIEENSYSVVDYSCKYFGSSYLGRQKGTKELIGITHKSPIIIEETTKLIFFPTTSPLRKDCNWISLNNIKKYYSNLERNSSIIEFKSGEKIELDMSIGSLTNQILRATRLQVVLSERINKNMKN